MMTDPTVRSFPEERGEGLEKTHRIPDFLIKPIISVFIIDPLLFKPNLDNLIDGGGIGSDVESDLRTSDKPGIYKPPQLAAVSYDDSRVSRDRRKEASLKVKGSRDRLLKDLREEFSTQPDEIRLVEPHEDEDLKRKERYEEEHFVRLPLTKKERQKRKRQQQQQHMLLHNEDFKVSVSRTTDPPYLSSR
jgi:hypothetical protein